MSDEELKSELERLRNENAALKKGASSGIRLKVSEKGAVSVYGMGRFPVTLYKGQWSELLNMSNEIRFYCCERSAVEGKRLCCGIVRWGVASVLFRAFKAYPDFVGNPPLEAARPHGFAVKG